MLREAILKSYTGVLASAALPGVQYSEPVGDPGLFGPDSAIWYVHEDVSSVVGGIAGLMLGTLNEPVLHGTNRFSGYRDDPLKRLGFTASFVVGMTYGSTPVTEKLAGMIRNMHKRVHGTMPDGRTFDANRSEDLIWVGTTQAYCTALAHRRYHPKPLRGSDLDRYYADYAVISEKLGATGVPKSRAEVNDYFAEIRPRLTVSEETHETMRFLRTPYGDDRASRLGGQILINAAADLLPPWARDLLGPAASVVFGRTPLGLIASRAGGYAITQTIRFGLGAADRPTDIARARVAAA